MNDDYTLVSALVVAISSLAGVIGYASRQIWLKLFAEEKGLFVKIVDRHLRFVDESAASMKINTESQSRISHAVDEIKEVVQRSAEVIEKQNAMTSKIEMALAQHHEDSQEFIAKFQRSSDAYTTTKTNEAIHHLARAGRAHLEGNDEDTLKELDAAERAVDRRNGVPDVG